MNGILPLNDAMWAGQTAAYTGTAGTLTGWLPGCDAVVVLCTTAAFVRVAPDGTGETATTGDTAVTANVATVFRIPATFLGAGKWTVSAIQVASGGNLYAKPVNIN